MNWPQNKYLAEFLGIVFISIGTYICTHNSQTVGEVIFGWLMLVRWVFPFMRQSLPAYAVTMACIFKLLGYFHYAWWQITSPVWIPIILWAILWVIVAGLTKLAQIAFHKNELKELEEDTMTHSNSISGENASEEDHCEILAPESAPPHFNVETGEGAEELGAWMEQHLKYLDKVFPDIQLPEYEEPLTEEEIKEFRECIPAEELEKDTNMLNEVLFAGNFIANRTKQGILREIRHRIAQHRRRNK